MVRLIAYFRGVSASNCWLLRCLLRIVPALAAAFGVDVASCGAVFNQVVVGLKLPQQFADFGNACAALVALLPSRPRHADIGRSLHCLRLLRG